MALVALEKAQSEAEKAFREVRRQSHFSNKPLWPARYRRDSVRSAYRFITEVCRTYNEADGSVELIPKKRYIRKIVRLWWECRRTGRTLIIEKSRRLIVSWVLRALQLWAMGLKKSKHIVVGLTYAKAAEHVWRIWHLWDEICKNERWHKVDSAKHWGGDPETQTLDMVVLPNGSLISKLNQESDTFQGSGYAEVHLEEPSLYRKPQSIFSQAKFVTEGVPGRASGFTVAVTNTAPNPDFWELKERSDVERDAHGKYPRIEPRKLLQIDPCEPFGIPLMPGMAMTFTRTESLYVALHYSSDPSKTPEWAKAARKGYTEREWDEQMEMSEETYSGDPVFKDFSPSRHCPKSIQESGIPIIPQSAYFGGWDVDLRPGFVLTQVSPSYQIHVILEVTSEGGETMEAFIPRVLEAMRKRIPGNWDQVYHGADATCVNRTAADGNSVQKVARSHGIKLRPQSNVIQVRLSDTTWALVDEIDERTPRLIVDPVHCPMLLKGFKGAYRFRETAGDEIGEERRINKPKKDAFAVPQDALQYNLRCARRFCEGKLNPFE